MKAILPTLVLAGFLGAAAVLPAQDRPYQPPTAHRIAKTINREWTFNYFPAEKADAMGCEAPGFNDSAWPAVALPHTWQTYETTGKVHPYIYDAAEKDKLAYARVLATLGDKTGQETLAAAKDEDRGRGEGGEGQDREQDGRDPGWRTDPFLPRRP